MDDNKYPAELDADLHLDPGFILIPYQRYEDLIRAETERDVLEATIRSDKYSADTVMTAILYARSKASIPEKPEGESDAQ